MCNKLIILRGPSGVGKSTVAHALQTQSKSETLIIDQDYYRHVLLANKPDEKNIVPEIIAHNTLTALRSGYNVILEGIFRKEKYLPMFQSLTHAFDGKTYTYYFDISFDETARRHATRDKSNLFSATEMKEWYFMAEPLGITHEYIISEGMPEAEITRLIQEQTQL